MLAKSKSRMTNYGTRIFVTINLVAILSMVLSFKSTDSKPFATDQEQNEFSGNGSEKVKESDSSLTKIVSAETHIKKHETDKINQTTIKPQKVVKGFVLNKYGKYIAGTAITIPGKNFGGITDAMGYFTLNNLTEDDSLTFSCAGYVTQTIKPDFVSEMVVRLVIKQESNAKIINTYMPKPVTTPLVVIDSMLIIVNGVVFTKELNDIPNENVETLRVLGNFEAIRKYGEKGKKGVIEIVTKDKGQESKEKMEVDTKKE